MPTPMMDQLMPILRSSWYTIAATLLMTIQPFLTTLTKNSNGTYDYAVMSTTFLAEVTKLLISSVFYSSSPEKQSHRALSRRDVLQFSVPAFVYFVNNNLTFIILMYVNSTTFQILSALKTVATGILFRVILKRELDAVQRAAIILLACGAATSQFPICQGCGSQLFDPSNATQVAAAAAAAEEAAKPNSWSGSDAIIGVAVSLLACFNSAFAGVYSELLLKKDGSLHSIHLQNMLLYAWGILFNGIALLVKDRERVIARGLFDGYSFAVWLLVTNNALNGLAISAILKFANNIVRVFAHTMAMMLTMILEVLLVSAPLSPQLCVSITVVSCSTFLYNSKPPPKKVVTAAMQPLEENIKEAGGESVPTVSEGDNFTDDGARSPREDGGKRRTADDLD